MASKLTPEEQVMLQRALNRSVAQVENESQLVCRPLYSHPPVGLQGALDSVRTQTRQPVTTCTPILNAVYEGKLSLTRCAQQRDAEEWPGTAAGYAGSDPTYARGCQEGPGPPSRGTRCTSGDLGAYPPSSMIAHRLRAPRRHHG
jgi:hypothetical protein